MDSTSVAVSAGCVAVSAPVAWAGVRVYRIYGEARVVTCPATMEEAVVKIHATRAIVSRLAGGNRLPLKSCSCWPERKNCDQACVGELRKVAEFRRPAQPPALKRCG